MTNYARHFATTKTPQSEPATPAQAKNSAGGFVFKIEPMAQLERWLILGSEGGTYYATERELTRENAATVIACLDRDGAATVAKIVEVSESGRAPKNDPAIFALAIACGHKHDGTRAAALAAMPRVCRTGTHLFQFAAAVRNFRGWGRGLRNAIARWYNEKTPEQLAQQVVKYRQRGGWTHRDLMRLAHPEPKHAPIMRWVVAKLVDDAPRVVKGHGKRAERTYPATAAPPPFLVAFDQLQRADKSQAIRLIREHSFTHEAVPSELLGSPEVWAALLPTMPMTAMIRNLGRMTANGLLSPLSEAVATVCAKLDDVDAIKRARVHPIHALTAMLTYKAGHGDKGKLVWSPVSKIIDALDAAFYHAFKAITPSGARTLLALDVSGSMDAGTVAGVNGLTPRMAAACMAMVTARTESNWHMVGFASPTGSPAGVGAAGGRWGGGTPRLVDVPITARMRLDDACAAMSKIPMGGTDCALPMLWADENRIGVDTFVVYTDNETWHGDIHPHQALQQYRNRHVRNAKLAVVSMTANAFSIAPPDDAGCLDLVGFDSSAPAVLASFSKPE